MRNFALLATIYAATVRPPLLTRAKQRTWRWSRLVMTGGRPATAAAHTCCVPENTRDNSRANNSRWSCKGDLVEYEDNGCWIHYYFDEPQDIVEMRIAFYKGTKETRTLNVYDNGNFHSQIESSGETEGYQTFYLDTNETADLNLYLDDYESNPDMWISIKEMKLMVE